MSNTLQPPRKARLQRSELAVPGSNSSFIDKAADSEADFVFLDLEDAVAPPDKPQARRNVIEALHDIDWAAKWAAPEVLRGQGGGSCPSPVRWRVQAVSRASCGVPMGRPVTRTVSWWRS